MPDDFEGVVLDVVLPTHNVGPWLAEALESVRGQSLTNWRAFVVLDGSTDASEVIARDFAARDARFTVHEASRRGVGHARNTGFSLGDAPFVIFVDPDDLVPANAFATLVDSLTASGSDLATGHAVQFRDQGKNWPYWTMQSDLFASPATGTNVRIEPRLILDHTTWNKAYRRSFLVDRDIRFPEDVAIGEDAHHTVEAICAANAIDVVTATVYRHRVRPHSLTSVIRESASVTEWVEMTRSIERLVRAVNEPTVTAVWQTRMLENEAWTRARHVGSIDDDKQLDGLLGLLRELCTAVPDTTWGSFPLTIRWAYEVLGVTAPALSSSFQGELVSAADELGTAAQLPEFERFGRELKMRGPQLHARVWRESLLMPFLRVVERLDATERQRALARVLAFHDQFVASHSLLPGDEELVSFARSEDHKELARWATSHRANAGTVEAHWTAGGGLRVVASVQTRAHDDIRRPIAVVAVSQGRIAGLTRPLGILDAAAPRVAGVRTMTNSLHIPTLRPFGQWAIGAVTGGAGEPSHFVPLQLTKVVSARGISKLRRMVQVSALKQPFVFESKASAPHRALAMLHRHRVVRGVLRRAHSAGGRLFRMARAGGSARGKA